MSNYTITMPANEGQYDASLKAVADAEQVLHEKATQRVEAQGAGPESILRQIASGRLDIDIEDVVALAFADDFAEAQEQGAKVLLNRAKAKGPFPPIVAAGIAHLVAESLDADVAVVDAFQRPNKGDLTVQVRQVTMTEHADSKGTGHGRIAATCDVEMYRTKRHVEADWSRLEKDLRKAGIIAAVHEHGSEEDGAVVVDRARVVVTSTPAYGKVLLGTDMPDAQLAGLGNLLLGRAQQAIREHTNAICETTVSGADHAPTFTLKGDTLTVSAVYTTGTVSARKGLSKFDGSVFGPLKVTKVSAEGKGQSRILLRDQMGRSQSVDAEAVKVTVEARVVGAGSAAKAA